MASVGLARVANSVREIERRRLAGTVLAVGGFVVIVGVTVAGTLYPGYSIHAQTISDLGGTDATGRLVQPAAAVFTLSMGVSGGLVVLAGTIGRSTLDDRLAGGLVVTGTGILGVATLPAHVGWPHALAALVAFAGGSTTAILAASTTRGAIRWLSATLGGVALLALAAFLVLGGSTPLGIGGLERLVSLPIQCWAILFGGWLLGRPTAAGDGH
ncbi:DUF998 domain-containing protein [Halorhabdus salina]|uniref:DUF998 domain-containing protein n=1 Tax=Halorhabdus salina TaxID=2750670 RepID=UPI0015EF29EB|nr:DUF998 domain-containing protein [Halorhabdus salina]